MPSKWDLTPIAVPDSRKARAALYPLYQKDKNFAIARLLSKFFVGPLDEPQPIVHCFLNNKAI